jgi:hypothetical protein
LKVLIEPKSPDPERPYLHLQPVVDALIRAGNTTYRSGFYLDPDGWRCDFAEPLAFDMLIAMFDFPDSIRVRRDFDAIHCLKSWSTIECGMKARYEAVTHR